MALLFLLMLLSKMQIALLLLPKVKLAYLLLPKMKMALLPLPKMEMALLLLPKMEMALLLLLPKMKLAPSPVGQDVDTAAPAHNEAGPPPAAQNEAGRLSPSAEDKDGHLAVAHDCPKRRWQSAAAAQNKDGSPAAVQDKDEPPAAAVQDKDGPPAVVQDDDSPLVAAAQNEAGWTSCCEYCPRRRWSTVPNSCVCVHVLTEIPFTKH